MSDPERNKQVVVDYYTTAFAGNPEKAIADHFGPRYIQHNPAAQDDPEAFIGFVKWLRGEYPNLELDIKRVIAEGDMVATHSHLELEPGNPPSQVRAGRLLPPGGRQGRRALGRGAGRPRNLREPEQHVLSSPPRMRSARPRPPVRSSAARSSLPAGELLGGLDGAVDRDGEADADVAGAEAWRWRC